MKNGSGHLILGDPWAASREDRMFVVKFYYKIEKFFFLANRKQAIQTPMELVR